MEQIRLSIKGDEKFVRDLQRSAAKLPRVFEQLGYRSAILMERALRLAYSEGPLFGRSNRLERSVHWFVNWVGGVLRAGAGTNVFYAIVHEQGRTIVPKEALALHFEVEPGKWVTVSRVVIPARKPGERAAESIEAEVREMWIGGLRELPVLGG